MRNSIILAVFFVLNLFQSSLFGQDAAPTPNTQQQAADQRQVRAEQQVQGQINANNARRSEELRRLSENSAARVRTVNRIDNGGFLPPPKLTEEQKTLLKPNIQDLNAYREFLKQPDTGLIKLFPDVGCHENSRVLRIDADCLNRIPNSSFYSFRREKYVQGIFADIRYKDDLLINDGFLMQGMMTVLGDVPLDKISLSSDGMDFLVRYKPEPGNQHAEAQMKKIVSGIKDRDYLYRNTWRTAENMTYALRSIAYRGRVPYQNRGFIFNLLDTDKRKDVIVVFRVVRKSSDGSITLLWKELDRKDSPKLIVQKNNKKNEK